MNNLIPAANGGNLAADNGEPKLNAAPPAELPAVTPAVALAVMALTGPRIGGIPAGKRYEDLTTKEREATYRMPLPDLSGLTDYDREAATMRADELDELLVEPVLPDQLHRWLGVLNGGVRNPQSETDFKVRAMAYWDLLADLPGAAFTAEARRLAAVRADGFMPGAADIRAVVEPVVQAWRVERDALRRIATAGPAPKRLAGATAEKQAGAANDEAMTDEELERRFKLWSAGAVVGIIAVQVRSVRRHLRETQPDLAERFEARFEALLGSKPVEQPRVPVAAEPEKRRKASFYSTEQSVLAVRQRLASGALSAAQASMERSRLAALEAMLAKEIDTLRRTLASGTLDLRQTAQAQARLAAMDAVSAKPEGSQGAA